MIPPLKDRIQLVRFIALTFVRAHERNHIDDTSEFSDGCFKLLEIVPKFQERISVHTGRKVQFRSFATPCIRNAIRDGRRTRCRKVFNGEPLDDMEIVDYHHSFVHNIEMRNIYDVLLSGLDVDDRAMMVFKAYLERWTYTAIGKMVGLEKTRVREIVLEVVLPEIRSRHATLLQRLKTELWAA